MEYRGLPWITVDYRGLPWITGDYKDAHGLPWITMDYGLRLQVYTGLPKLQTPRHQVISPSLISVPIGDSEVPLAVH